MSIQIAHSTKTIIQEAVDELKTRLSNEKPAVVVYFSSSSYAAGPLSNAMQRAFPASKVCGCTTAGELVSGSMLKNSVVAMTFPGTVIKKSAVAVVENIKDPRGLKDRVTRGLKSLEKEFGTPLSTMDPSKYVGMILIDGLSLAEEAVMDALGDLTNITFVGGSAGDDLKFEKTFVSAQGTASNNAALLVLLEPAVPFGLIKTQSFQSLKKILKATAVNEATRTVMEFNGKPAPEAYAEALGVSAGKAAEHFMRNPLGLMLDNEPYVRSPQRIDGGTMVFYCNIKKGMELAVLESSDMIKDTRAALEAKKRELGRVSGIINFNCILRTLDLEQHGLTKAYGDIFADIPTIGFSTYGEEYIGHINQTATMLVFG